MEPDKTSETSRESRVPPTVSASPVETPKEACLTRQAAKELHADLEKPGWGELSTLQRTVLLHLAGGRSFTEVARICGISRQTLYNWRDNDPHFGASLNYWQSNAVASANNNLIALLDDATEAVAMAVQDGNAAISMQLLHRMGAFEPAKLDKTPPPARALPERKQITGTEIASVETKKEGDEPQ